MRPLEAFAARFGGKVALNAEFIVEKTHRFYLLNPRLKKLQGNFYYAGMYLGKVKNGFSFQALTC